MSNEEEEHLLSGSESSHDEKDEVKGSHGDDLLGSFDPLASSLEHENGESSELRLVQSHDLNSSVKLDTLIDFGADDTDSQSSDFDNGKEEDDGRGDVFIEDGIEISPPHAPRPTRGYVPFSSLSGPVSKELPSDVQEALSDIRSSLDGVLFFWAEFPLSLPPSDLKLRGHEVIDLDSLFIAPTVSQEELASLAFDENGRKYLSPEQLEELRRKGSFSVASEQFPGKVHVWTVANWLQKGSESFSSAQESIFSDWFSPMYTLPRSVYSNLSVGVRSLFHAVTTLPSALFGFMDRIRKFPEDRVQNICDDRYIAMLKDDLVHLEGFLYRSTKTGETYDFTLHFSQEWNRISSVLRIVENDFLQEWKVFEIERKKEFFESIDEATGARILRSPSEQQRFIDYLEETKESRLLDHIQQQKNIPVDTLLQHWKACKIVSSIISEAHYRYQKRAEEVRKRLCEEHKIRSKSFEWLQNQVEIALSSEKEELARVPECIGDALRREGLSLAAYLFQSRLDWVRLRVPEIKRELERELIPRYQFELIRYYWSPHSWEITGSPENGFYAKTNATYTISSGYPLWRLINTGCRLFTWWSNISLGLSVSLWCSPFSIRSLFYLNTFYPYKRVNYRTGRIEVDVDSPVTPFASRIRSLWQHVFESRRVFEEERDSGFLGKNVTRLFNRIWNYLFIGIGGTALLSLTYPPLILLNCAVSFLLLVSSPLWCPVVVFLGYIFGILIYDFDTGHVGSLLKVLYRLIKGVAYILFGGFGLAITVPLFFTILTSLRTFFNQVHSLQDFTMFHLFLKHFARVPDCDGFLIRRIAGPGLRSDYRYQISPEIVVLACHAYLEEKEVQWYASWVRKMNAYPKIFGNSQLFKYFSSLGHISNGPLNHFYSREEEKVGNRLNAILRQWEKTKPVRPLGESVKYSYSHSIRQDPVSLQRTIYLVRDLCEKFYTSRLFPYFSSGGVSTFWTNQDLIPNDWEGLAKLTLTALFGDSFLIPLEMEGEVDDPYNTETVVLNVHHVNASEYCSMIFHGNLHDPLKSVSAQTTTYKLSMEPSVWRRSLSNITYFFPRSCNDMASPDPKLLQSLNFSALFQKNTVDIQRVKACTPILDGHGLRISIFVSQPSDYWIEEPTLSIEGPQIWGAIERIVGGSLVSIGKMFLPLPLSSLLRTESSADETCTYHIEVGTGVQGPYSRVKFRDETIFNMLHRLSSEFENPPFDLVIRVKNSKFGPMELFRITVLPEDLLHHLRDGSSPLVYKVHASLSTE